MRILTPPIVGLLLGLAGEAVAEPAVVSFEFAPLRSDRGQVVCRLYAVAEAWMKVPWRDASVAVRAGRATCSFAEVPPGTYAMSAFHDENGNKKLDTNLLGMPKEGVCASNQAKGVMGPPKWKAASFVYSGGALRQQLVMRYL